MPRATVLRLAWLLCLAVSTACSPPRVEPAEQRIAAPPALVPVLNASLPAAMRPARFVPLLPYGRARDIEVLLLSSASTAYGGIVVQGRSLGVLGRWASPLPGDWLAGLRDDLRGCVSGPGGARALPLTMDTAVLVYRRDWWEQAGQAAPADLPDLRGTLLTFRAGRSRLSSPVLSLVPAEELFWDLAWSYEGRADAALYTYPKLQALRFLQEFDLVPRMEESTCAEALVEGTAGAAFVEASQAGSIVETAAKAGVPLTVAPIPGQGGVAICLFTGWCVVRTGGQGGAPRAWNALLGPSVQTTLARGGFLPLLKGARSPGGPSLWSALDRTRFQPPPDLGPDGDAVVRGAVSDATEAGMAPEEALRRAEARLREGMRP